MTIMLHIH